MSTAFPLLTVQDTVVAAQRICAAIDASRLPHRALTGVTLSEIASMAILVGQLDRIAQAAAEDGTGPRDFDRWYALQDLLVAAGYLPLPSALPALAPPKEPAHGQS